jgi:preprotein translocase subunit Sss1
MKRVLLISIACIGWLISSGNAAMPGMWGPGHGGRFYPLFKEDSIYFGKIQMQRELVLINLYPGFAAVKGEYWMYNTTDKPVTMRVGYPINGRYDAALVSNVMFEDIYRLTALVNDQPANVIKAAEGYDSVYRVIDQMQMNNWYYFTCTFAPKQLTKITVYFLTNNNDVALSKGYARDYGNAFAYILESGRAWAGKIESGQVLINLKDDLSIKDFRGVYPVNTLVGDKKHLQFEFTNLEPDSSNNILLWYHPGKHENFKFKTILANTTAYFKELDVFPLAEFHSAEFKKIDKDDFKPHDSSFTWFWILLALGLIVIGAVIGIIIYLVRKLIRRRAN